MKKNILSILLSGILSVTVFFVSCDRDPVEPPTPVVGQISIADLRDMFQGDEISVDTNVYIQGIITLTPELGNVPDFIAYIQDTTAGITLTVDGTNSLTIGSEVKILCQGLSLSDYNDLLQFGYVDLSLQYELIDVDAGLPDPEEATISEILDGEFVAQYVELTGVQFDGSGTYSGTNILTDCSDEVDVYTRSAATFSGDAIPTGNGTLRGVVSTYYDPQILLVDPSDLDMTGTRCGEVSDYLSEDFESLSGDESIDNLSGWKSIPEVGDEDWVADDYSNVSALITAYYTTESSVITWMITPAVDLSSSSSPVLNFESKARYHNGAELQVLISTAYDGSESPESFSWTALNPTLDEGSTSGSSTWVSSGDVDLSGYKSVCYIAFKYIGGNPDLTTTWQIDDVVISEAK